MTARCYTPRAWRHEKTEALSATSAADAVGVESVIDDLLMTTGYW